ncbi:MAG: S9 family peptidase [Gemmatimonadales bacterium]
MRESPRVSALLVTMVGAAAVVSAAHAQTRPFNAEDMLDVVRISGRIALSPTGDRLAYVLPDLADEWNVYERLQVGTVHVQRISHSGAGQAEPLGPSGQRSSFPAFSPDGANLAFYVERPRGGQLAVWNARTGKVRVLGASFSGKPFAAPQWAGPGRIIYARPTASDPKPQVPRVTVMHSTDEVLPGDAFFANRRRAGLAVIDIETGVARTLLDDREPLRRFEVSPDGRRVLAALPSSETAGVYRREVNGTLVWSLDSESDGRKIAAGGERISWLPDGRLFWRSKGRLVTLDADRPGPAEGGEPEPFMENLKTAITRLVWSPDGKRFVSLVRDPSLTDPEIEPPKPNMFTIARPFMDLYLMSRSGDALTNLTSEIDDQISDPVWSVDGSALFFRAIDNATYDETIYRYDLKRQRLSPVARGEESYSNLMAVPGGLLVTIQSATTPGDVWRIDAANGKRVRVTELNPQLRHFAFSRPELFHFHNGDGERLGALLYKPTGVTGDTGIPVITYVYEKLTPGIHRFSARHQIFATHGYAVLMPNVKVKVGETGTSFVKTVVPAVNAVRAMGFTNDRFCLWGGSFGAYATSYVITQTNIFSCAVSRATPPELFRNWASGRDRDSDNIERGQARMGGSPFEVMERYLSQSAFFHLDKVETPVLLMHGVKDYTILYGEGEMMFYALRRLGKKATLVSYRDGDHSLSRHSRQDTIDVHRRMLEWFNKYLRPDGGVQTR